MRETEAELLVDRLRAAEATLMLFSSYEREVREAIANARSAREGRLAR